MVNKNLDLQEIEQLEVDNSIQEEKKKKKKRKFRIGKFTVLVIIMDILFVSGLLVIESKEFKNFWIPTAMTTMSHKYLAFTLYDEETVYKIMSENYIEKNTEVMNLDDIVIGDTTAKKHYTSKYEQELFTRDPGNEVYKTIRIVESKFKGWVIGIYDPSDVSLAVSSKLGKAGQSVNTLVKNNNGLVGINGGGFEDLDGWGNGSIPYGAIIKDGVKVWEHSGGSGGLIGFTKDHKMYLTDKTPEEAIQDGMVDAVDFGPNLIVNGKVSKIHGDGGWGTAPRSVIAQRKDGVVLFVIIEGRLPGYSIGATMNDVIEILLRYKAYNAANLDGGASSTMSIEGKLWNRPSAGAEYGGRTVSNAWIVTNKQNKPAQAPVKSNYK
ncbi:MAG: phosphodiester glycosidase family protein [Bacilli bacterium]|nr:phosphodiester glycosidase family protein [Bacilli bacterium]